MSGQTANTSPGVPAGAGDDTAMAGRGIADARPVDAESLPSRPGADDAHADPSLEGIPREVIDNVGVYDTDSAGGCG